MNLRSKVWMSACAAALLGVSSLAAQNPGAGAPERLPAPTPAPAPAHGAVHAAPTYHYQPACCQPDCCGGHALGWSFGAEAVYLRPHESEDDVSGHDYEIGYRIWGAVESDGLGLRVRYFDWDESSPGSGNNDTYEITVVDIEVTMGMELGCGFNLTGSAGVRYAEYSDIVDFGEGSRDIDGIDESYGLVIGLELSRCLCGNTAAYASFRHAFMFGDEADESSTNDKYQTYTITELQLGVEFRCECGFGDIFVRGGAEAQFWAGVNDDDSENFGLFGGFFGVGIRK